MIFYGQLRGGEVCVVVILFIFATGEVAEMGGKVAGSRMRLQMPFSVVN